MNPNIKIGAVMAISVITLALGGMFVLQIAVVNAATTGTSIYDQVLQKLGITNVTATQLQDTIRTTRQEVMVKERETNLLEALNAKKITQAQYDLAKRLFVIRESQREEMRAKFEAMSETERLALRGTRPFEADKESLAKQLNISLEDLVKLETALRDAGVVPQMGKGMGMRGGHMGGMMD